MKSINCYIIYNEEYKQSKANAHHCADTMKKFNNYTVHLYNGCHPDTLAQYEEMYQIGNQRKDCRYNIDNSPLYSSKKSCFYSHFSLWLKCVELNQPIIVLENDVYCNTEFPLEQLHDLPEITQAALGNIILKKKRGRYGNVTILKPEQYKQLPEGIILFKDILNPQETPIMGMHGNMAYIIKPKAAARIIMDARQNGWQQNDRFMQHPKFEIGFYKPDIFIYDIDKELHLSLEKKNG